MSRANMTDLIVAARGGDPSAMHQLLLASQPDIKRYAHMSCRQSSDVDDAVQDSLWLLYRHVGKLQKLASFSAWLFMVVRRECIKIARRAMGQTQELTTIEDDLSFAFWPDEMLRLDISAAFGSLPTHYRDIIIQRDIEELTIEEIAISQNLTREAVKARLHRARLMVREYLKD
ncbi:MAG: sigma-70 family RNA polymerase sigma factor [Mesorhizobium sp.]